MTEKDLSFHRNKYVVVYWGNLDKHLHDKEGNNDDGHNLMAYRKSCYMNNVRKSLYHKEQFCVHSHSNKFEWLLLDRADILHSDIVVYIDEFHMEGVLNMVDYMYSLGVGDAADYIELWILFYHRGNG